MNIYGTLFLELPEVFSFRKLCKKNIEGFFMITSCDFSMEKSERLCNGWDIRILYRKTFMTHTIHPKICVTCVFTRAGLGGLVSGIQEPVSD